MSTITKLKISNTLRIEAAEITPEGSPLVIIGGRNDQGKTSVLNSIMAVLGGAQLRPDELLRRGKDKGEIVVESDLFTATLRLTPQGQTLTVANREGAKYPSPQAFLDRLCAKISFDPLAFVRLGETPEGRRKQLQTLRDLIGIDTSKIDQERTRVFEERTELNRQAAAQTAIVSSYPLTGPAMVDVKSMMQELETFERENQQTAELVRMAEAADRAAVAALEAVEKQASAIRSLEEQLGKARANLETLKQRAAEADKAANEAEDKAAHAPRHELGELKSRIARASETNTVAMRVAMRKEQQTKLDYLTEKIEKATQSLKALDDLKHTLISSAQMPVSGLGIADSGITFNGLPLEQASSASQLRVGLAIAIATNPKMKVMLIRNGSLLDQDSMKIVQEMAEAAEAQVWVEVVGENENCTVVIEDGRVK